MVAAASQGIGLATAKLLADEGCRVSICSRSHERLAAVLPLLGPNARAYEVDVTSEDDLSWWHEQTVKDLGPVSILVTNTGGPPTGLLKDLTEDQWRAGIDSTLMNVLRMVRLVEGDMAKAGWGRIVHVSSLVAREPTPILAISATLRAGLVALTRLQAEQLGPSGVTVNSVLPGHTLTDRQIHLADVNAARMGITREAALQMQAQHSSLKRLGKPEEVAAAIAFLCSQPAAYISGQSLLVDGASVAGI